MGAALELHSPLGPPDLAIAVAAHPLQGQQAAIGSSLDSRQHLLDHPLRDGISRGVTLAH